MRVNRRSILAGLLAATTAAALFWTSATQPPAGQPERAHEPTPVRDSVRLASPPAAGRAYEPAAARSTRGYENETGPPVADDVVVWGTVQTSLGDLVDGEQVELFSKSLNKRYVATSDRQGEFLFSGVLPADDYVLSVDPEGLYEPYNETGVALETLDRTLTIVLEPIPVGLLQGRIVDAGGRPVPGFDVYLRSLAVDRGFVNARTDSVGLFVVAGFPAGRFEVLAREHLLRIDGLRFEPGAGEPMILVIDHGPHRLTGRVYDDHGQPLAGATVLLGWKHSQGNGRSVMERRTLTDSDGAFAINGLGQGLHDLTLSLTRGTAVKRRLNIGLDVAEVILHLERSPGDGGS